ncbi:gamma-glutamyltransferase 1 Threonine peptidase. MEROPS family T03 [Aquipseudomonas alcaligenes]|uniref:gamma-glutamyltransferase n=1 Tax=Aquipseudomonas alcaligenes TaxID=43263 RepID=UPI000955D19C|nr:gamma-glutamyltransferase [Pseudomonas alcaligenes]SIS17680.1 gamma-glutamyltransferase 1 Threonine peptidase. MEROPS family T03 [Pseudomonas alcaligenes]
MPYKTLLACLLLTCTLAAQAAAPKPQQAAVATAHPAATVAGLETLAHGGNAFDAAVAIAAALAVAEPYGSGLGGGGFFLLRQAGEKPSYRFVDARERAPLAAGPDLYRRNGTVQRELSLNGPLAAAIPGLPAALAHLAERYGKLPLNDSLTPAIRLARDGVGIDRVYRERAEWRLEALKQDPASASIFLDQGQVPPLHGLLRQPALVRTLERLARDGHAGFYAGETARLLLEGVRKSGGVWSERDLRDYRVVERQPLRIGLEGGLELITAPPPSAGGIALAQSLLMLQELPWQKAGAVQRSHYVVEVLRRAYRDRGLLGDPDQVHNPLPKLLAPDYLENLAKGIALQHATPSTSLPPAPGWREGDHTTHFTVLDTEGNAVAATLSINLPFGAAFTAPGTGVLLNNEMDDFAAAPSGSNAYGLTGSQANLIAPGKRPLSSMSPTFIESKAELASFGTPGGSRIPSMVLLAVLDYLNDKPVQQWPATPRYHHQYLPDVIEYEPDAFSASQLRSLEMRGHRLQRVERHYGNQQVLLWNKESGQVEAASDPRGVGRAALWK